MRGVNAPLILVTSDREPIEIYGNWLGFVGAEDIDIKHVNIVTFRPGGTIPFAELCPS